METRKDIKWFECKYAVSDLGNIKNIRTNRIIKTHLFWKRIIVNIKWCTLSLARVVCVAFHINHENKRVVDHINNNPLDNRACNLQRATYKENADYSYNRDKRIRKRR